MDLGKLNTGLRKRYRTVAATPDRDVRDIPVRITFEGSAHQPRDTLKSLGYKVGRGDDRSTSATVSAADLELISGYNWVRVIRGLAQPTP